MNLYDRITDGARALAKAGHSFRDFEHEQNKLQLKLITSPSDATAILAAAARVGHPNTGTAERVAIELAKAGLTADLIAAALPAIFAGLHLGERMPVPEALRRAEFVAACTNTLALTPHQVSHFTILLRYFTPEETRP